MNIQHDMKHKAWLIGAGLLVVVLIVLVVAQPWKPHKSTSEITANTETAANNYLISKVGYDNFKKLYTFDKARGGYGDSNSTYDFLAYHFAPFKTFVNPEDIVMVQVNKHEPTEVFADVAPDCKKDKSLCDFNIDKQKSLQIAQDNGITADDVTVSTANMKDEYAKKNGLAFVIIVQSCKQNKSVVIDYRNGAILGSETNCENVQL